MEQYARQGNEVPVDCFPVGGCRAAERLAWRRRPHEIRQGAYFAWREIKDVPPNELEGIVRLMDDVYAQDLGAGDSLRHSNGRPASSAK